jgi:hypothetical protein
MLMTERSSGCKPYWVLKRCQEMPDEKLFKRRKVMEEDALSKTRRGRR